MQDDQSKVEVMFLPAYVCMSLDSGRSRFMAIATGRDVSQVLEWLKKQPGSSGKYIVEPGYSNYASNLKQIYVKFRHKDGESKFNSEVDSLAMQFKLSLHNKEWPVNK